jgi:hypothetical protein
LPCLWSPTPLLKRSDARSRNTGAKRPGKDPGVLRRHRDVPSENPLRRAQSEGTPQRFSAAGRRVRGAFLCVLSCRDKKGRRPPGRDPAHIIVTGRSRHPASRGTRTSLCIEGDTLPNPHPGVSEHAQPSAILAPVIGMPGVADRAEHPFRMGHKDRETAVRRGEASDTEW